MPEQAADELPFRVRFAPETGEVVVMMTYGNPPRQTMRRKTYDSTEALAIAIAEHHHESYLQARLANELAAAAITHLGADPGRLQKAVRALSDPTSTVPVGSILRGERQP
ncbi:hypothetical protein GCM10010218_49910 [Streptomyces mashuensis]|uniref:Uncharacterized protein n=1 Tax=Streptomyces mashuensis TaxID=33904 RepID=A0A919B6X9_9ACTN|nr:hypothetical protein [Streptomyces mashuensis]GHF62459.1 hypothetical protein GCM10010218_49910 [Streptomyces mashuensis]